MSPASGYTPAGTAEELTATVLIENCSVDILCGRILLGIAARFGDLTKDDYDGAVP